MKQYKDCYKSYYTELFLLKEVADDIIVNGRRYDHKASEVKYIFIIYYDKIDKRENYISFNLHTKTFESNSTGLLAEINDMQAYTDIIFKREECEFEERFVNYTIDDMTRVLNNSSMLAKVNTHLFLLKLLVLLRRSNGEHRRESIDGRIYIISNIDYVCLWKNLSYMSEHNRMFFEMLRELKIDKYAAQYQFDFMSDDKFVSYEDSFGSTTTFYTNVDDKTHDFKRQLHMKKAAMELPPAWNNAIDKL
jgi:hypothetical protein